jgi:hypothetical protein
MKSINECVWVLQVLGTVLYIHTHLLRPSYEKCILRIDLTATPEYNILISSISHQYLFHILHSQHTSNTFPLIVTIF